MKYLCYHFGTKESCFKYKGSGVQWRKYISVHKNKVHTLILAEADTRDILRVDGLFYSNLWDIVHSNNFANLIVEDCSTSFEKINHTQYRKHYNKLTSIRQKGKTMKERLNNPNYQAYNKGEKMSVINPGYQVWNKGKRMHEVKGPDYIDPKSKPFKVTINGAAEIVCQSEQDCFKKIKLNTVTLYRLKRQGVLIIKRQKNSRHNFITGDVLTIIFI